MASEKIELKVGSSCNGEGLEKAQKAVRNTSDGVKKASESMAQFGAIFGNMDSTIGKVAGGVFNFVESIKAAGGPIAITATAAIAMVTAIIKWKKAQEEAAEAHRKLMEAMREGQAARIEADLAALAEREQAALDAMAESAANTVKELVALTAAFKGLASAQDAGIGAELNLSIAKINDEFSRKLAEAAAELQPLVSAERDLAVALEEQKFARMQQQRAVERETVALQDAEAKIAAQKEVIAAEIAAGRDAVAARQELQKMEIERSACEQRLKNATLTAETTQLKHETAVREARAAVTNATNAWNKAVAANELANEAVEENAALSRIHDEITRICMKNEVEAASYIKLYTDSIANGLTHTEAYAALQEKLNEELQKRAEAEKKAAEKAAAEAAKSAKEKAEEEAAKNRPVLSSSLSVSIDPNEVGAGVSQSEPVTATRLASEALSEQAKQDAQVRENMRADVQGMQSYLNDHMKPDMEDAWRKVMAEKYSADQLRQIYETAMENMLGKSKSEREIVAEKIQKLIEIEEKQVLK